MMNLVHNTEGKPLLMNGRGNALLLQKGETYLIEFASQGPSADGHHKELVGRFTSADDTTGFFGGTLSFEGSPAYSTVAISVMSILKAKQVRPALPYVKTVTNRQPAWGAGVIR